MLQGRLRRRRMNILRESPYTTPLATWCCYATPFSLGSTWSLILTDRIKIFIWLGTLSFLFMTLLLNSKMSTPTIKRMSELGIILILSLIYYHLTRAPLSFDSTSVESFVLVYFSILVYIIFFQHFNFLCIVVDVCFIFIQVSLYFHLFSAISHFYYLFYFLYFCLFVFFAYF